MSHKASAVLALLLLGTLGSAAADDRCVGPDGIASCAVESLERADHEMQSVYARVLRSAAAARAVDGRPAVLRTRLARAQGRWVEYRKAVCQLEAAAALTGNPNRGNLGALAETSCMQRMAESRAKELAAFEAEYLN